MTGEDPAKKRSGNHYPALPGPLSSGTPVSLLFFLLLCFGQVRGINLIYLKREEMITLFGVSFNEKMYSSADNSRGPGHICNAGDRSEGG